MNELQPTPNELIQGLNIEPNLISIQSEIRLEFGWSIDADRTSLERLVRLVEELQPTVWGASQRLHNLETVVNRLGDADRIYVLGAAVEPDELRTVLGVGVQLICADGAVGVISELNQEEEGMAWDCLCCVITDADGGMERLVSAASRNVPLILHAHGDNLDQWTELVLALDAFEAAPPLSISHQTPESRLGCINWGGFTDGDRAACLAVGVRGGVADIELLGFSDASVGRWSGITDAPRKLRKLKWMSSILARLGF
jgi:uncharacterized Rossmann fold enzyme